MAKALTVRSIETIKPPATRTEVPDGMVVGLYLVLQPTGKRSWAVRYRFDGRSCKLTLGAYPLFGLLEARAEAREALQLVAKGEDPAARRRLAPDSADESRCIRILGAEFLRRHASANKTAAETQRVLEREIYPRWGDRVIDEITRRDVIDLIDGVVDRGSPIMANRVLAVVRKFFNWALSRDLIPISPAAGVKPPGVETKRDRVLTDDEIQLFWRACESLGWPFGPMFQLLLLTGQRREEVGGISWSEVDGDLWKIPGARTKNGKAHDVPLTNQVLRLLRSVPRGNGDAYVFSRSGNTPASGFSKAKRRLDLKMAELARVERGATYEIPHWVLHDLRRTAASGMARLGINLPMIERILNHTSGSFAGVAGVYNRYSFAAEMRTALSGWANFVESLIVNPRGQNDVQVAGKPNERGNELVPDDPGHAGIRSARI